MFFKGWEYTVTLVRDSMLHQCLPSIQPQMQFLSLLLVMFFIQTDFEYQIFSCLERSLETIRKECHWLRSVSWDLCAQCRLCAGKVDSNTRRCIWHNRERCSHDDCAHYIALKSSQYFCPHAKSRHAFLPKERYEHWLQVRWFLT